MSFTEIEIELTQPQLERVTDLIMTVLPHSEHSLEGLLTEIFMAGVTSMENGQEDAKRTQS